MSLPHIISAAPLTDDRHADDVDMVLSDEVRFHKGSVYAKGGGEWLGRGLFTQTDRDAHGAMRATLSPAFRADYLKQVGTVDKTRVEVVLGGGDGGKRQQRVL